MVFPCIYVGGKLLTRPCYYQHLFLDLYLVQVIEREAYATGCHWPWTFCSRTAPKPWQEASAEMVVSVLGSYSVRMLGVVSSFLRFMNSSCVGVQIQVFFALNSSCNGLDNYVWREFAKLVYHPN